MKIRKSFFLILSVLIILVMIFIVLKLVSSEQFWRYVQGHATVTMFKNENIESLSVGDKYTLFDAFYNKRDFENALTVGSQLKDQIEQLPKGLEIVVAGKMGGILRSQQNYDLEFLLYDDLLKTRNPQYYHFFRGNSYNIQGKVDLAKEELLKAKELADRPEFLQIINAELQKIS